MEATLTEDERIKLAEQSSMLTILAVLLCLMSCCGVITVFLAVPISMWSLYLARNALATEDPSPVVYAWASPARTLSVATLLYSGLVSAAILAYVGLYAFMIFAMIGIGAFA